MRPDQYRRGQRVRYLRAIGITGWRPPSEQPTCWVTWISGELEDGYCPLQWLELIPMANCKGCKFPFPSYELANELCLSCIAKELDCVKKQLAVEREDYEKAIQSRIALRDELDRVCELLRLAEQRDL